MDDDDGRDRVVTPAVATALERLKAVRLEAEKLTLIEANMGLYRVAGRAASQGIANRLSVPCSVALVSTPDGAPPNHN